MSAGLREGVHVYSECFVGSRQLDPIFVQRPKTHKNQPQTVSEGVRSRPRESRYLGASGVFKNRSQWIN